MGAPRPLIAGNWKMHGRRSDLTELTALDRLVESVRHRIDVLICPPVLYLGPAREAAGRLLVGAQDCSPMSEDAARTGEVSCAMLAEMGASHVIVGHSERRSLHAETDALVHQKASAALAAGLTPIICVGETQAEHDAGQVSDVVTRQVRNSVPAAKVVIAYEPVWAIGGDRTPSLAEIGDVHALVRRAMADLFGDDGADAPVLYGGSVNSRNAGDVFSAPGVDGALVGRASLRAEDFAKIILAHPAAS